MRAGCWTKAATASPCSARREANSFSTGERQALLEAAVAAGIAPDGLLPGTGVTALTETVALTQHALSLGVTTVVMLPPFDGKGVSR